MTCCAGSGARILDRARWEAIQAYEKAIAVNPYYWVSYSALGTTHCSLGLYEKAAEALKKVIELDPRTRAVTTTWARPICRWAVTTESAAAFKKRSSSNPSRRRTRTWESAYAYAGKHADAIPMFEKAVELAPNSELLSATSATVTDGADSGEAAAAYDKAIAFALKELQVNPRNAMARGNTALYYAKKGDSGACAA